MKCFVFVHENHILRTTYPFNLYCDPVNSTMIQQTGTAFTVITGEIVLSTNTKHIIQDQKGQRYLFWLQRKTFSNGSVGVV